MKKYQVIDSRTQYIMGTYSTMRRALNKADKLDNIFGGYRYQVIEIKE